MSHSCRSTFSYYFLQISWQSAQRFRTYFASRHTLLTVLINAIVYLQHKALNCIWHGWVSATTSPNLLSISVKLIKLEIFLCFLRSLGCGGHLEMAGVQLSISYGYTQWLTIQKLHSGPSTVCSVVQGGFLFCFFQKSLCNVLWGITLLYGWSVVLQETLTPSVFLRYFPE